jgi:hypothetical protein
MKQILLLLIAINCFSQNNEVSENQNFSVNNENLMIWTKIYEIDSVDVLSKLRQKQNLNFINENSGIAVDLKLRCKKTLSMYAEDSFKINFRIDFKENKYRIVVSNIVFNNSFQFNYAGVSTSKITSNIEEYELRNKDNQLRKNSQSLSNRICLDEFFDNLFSIKNIKEDKW